MSGRRSRLNRRSSSAIVSAVKAGGSEGSRNFIRLAPFDRFRRDSQATAGENRGLHTDVVQLLGYPLTLFFLCGPAMLMFLTAE